LYDVYKPEGKEIIKTITELMENQGFPTKCYFGTNYHEMKSVSS
jgi:hypothetical protein